MAIDQAKLDELLGRFVGDLGAVFHATTVLVSRTQDVDLALGAQAGEAQIRDVMTRAGFTGFLRAAESPFNLVLEARS